MTSSTEATLADAVIARLEAPTDPRFTTVMAAVIRHLHALVREVELTEDEWFEAIRFLTATGQTCDARRQEFILLSDVLGVSMLVDAINHRRPAGATENTVLGPFYVHGAPDRANGDDIAAGWDGERTFVSGRVLDVDGRPIGGALLDIWQADHEGHHDVQLPESGKQLRARLHSEPDGRFWFRTIRPRSYPVPTDGPVGRILDRMGRHPFRPGHIHFIVSAPGYETAVTHIFVKGDPYLDSDAVFGVKSSLVVDFVRDDREAEARRLGLTAPFYRASYDFVLKPAEGTGRQRVISAGDAVRA